MRSLKQIIEILNEDTPTNNVGGGNIAGVKGNESPPVKKKRDRFAGTDVFDVDSDTFMNARHGRKKWERYAKMGKSDCATEVANYCKKHPGKGAVLKDQTTGAMLYLRRNRISESRVPNTGKMSRIEIRAAGIKSRRKGPVHVDGTTDYYYDVGPNQKILFSVTQSKLGWRKAKKTVGLFARKLEKSTRIKTLEGTVTGTKGAWICYGAIDEPWVQEEKKLFGKYKHVPKVTKKIGNEIFTRFEPKPDSSGVAYSQMNRAFKVTAGWGTIKGKKGDYIVCKFGDHKNPSIKDVWIVDKKLFDATYKEMRTPSKNKFNENLTTSKSSNTISAVLSNMNKLKSSNEASKKKLASDLKKGMDNTKAYTLHNKRVDVNYDVFTKKLTQIEKMNK